eukprot:1590676-Pyramimonas_sp.AAC.1
MPRGGAHPDPRQPGGGGAGERASCQRRARGDLRARVSARLPDLRGRLRCGGGSVVMTPFRTVSPPIALNIHNIALNIHNSALNIHPTPAFRTVSPTADRYSEQQTAPPPLAPPEGKPRSRRPKRPSTSIQRSTVVDCRH